MKEDPSLDQSLKEWADLFSDPASSLSAFLKKRHPSESALITPLFLALWLEFFLVAEEKEVKEQWDSLSGDEQIGLGIELLKCYWVQPLYIRLSKNEKSSIIKSPLKLESRGKLFRVEQGTGTNRKIEFLYPLNHLRFWPDLFGLFPNNFFSSEKVFKTFEPRLLLAASSRLDKIRQRAETLNTFFFKGKSRETSSDFPPEDLLELKNIPEDTPRQVVSDIHPPKDLEPKQPTPSVSDLSAAPVLPPKRKKKKKKPMDQMELF